MIDVYFCHRYKFCTVASDIGYSLGTRADQFDSNKTQKLLDDGYAVPFVDNNFKDPKEDRIYDIATTCDAEFAVCPDITDADDLGNVLSFGRRLERENITPIVVPKDDFDFSQIPSDWRIGFSVPSGYGSTDIPIADFTEHEVHLLGGSPKNQLVYANKAVENDINIVSVDGNSFSKAAGYGNIINKPSALLNGGNAWDYDIDHPSDWSGCLYTSLVRYFLLWRDWSEEKL